MTTKTKEKGKGEEGKGEEEGKFRKFLSARLQTVNFTPTPFKLLPAVPSKILNFNRKKIINLDPIYNHWGAEETSGSL